MQAVSSRHRRIRRWLERRCSLRLLVHRRSRCLPQFRAKPALPAFGEFQPHPAPKSPAQLEEILGAECVTGWKIALRFVAEAEGVSGSARPGDPGEAPVVTPHKMKDGGRGSRREGRRSECPCP